MLTLKMLRELVGTPPKGKRFPTWKELRENYDVFAHVKAGRDGAEVIVYENGYVVYHIQERCTVFPINLETEYTYSSVADSFGRKWANEDVPKTSFDDAEWYLLLILIGEDRLQANANRGYREQNMSGDGLRNDGENLEGKKKYYNSQMEDDLMLEELVRELMGMLTDRQKAVVQRVFWEEMTHKEIADELGMKSRTSVTNMLSRALSVMRKAAEEEREKNSKKLSPGRDI